MRVFVGARVALVSACEREEEWKSLRQNSTFPYIRWERRGPCGDSPAFSFFTRQDVGLVKANACCQRGVPSDTVGKRPKGPPHICHLVATWVKVLIQRAILHWSIGFHEAGRIMPHDTSFQAVVALDVHRVAPDAMAKRAILDRSARSRCHNTRCLQG